MDRGDRLDLLLDSAIKTLQEVMDTDAQRYDEDFARILSTKKDAAVSVMNVTLKADENKFRARAADGLQKLLELVILKEKVITMLDL